MGQADDAEISRRRDGYVIPSSNIPALGYCEEDSGAYCAFQKGAVGYEARPQLTTVVTGKCYVREGVNHLEKCGKYRGTDQLSITITTATV
jgi:hypothetical protein